MFTKARTPARAQLAQSLSTSRTLDLKSYPGGARYTLLSWRRLLIAQLYITRIDATQRTFSEPVAVRIDGDPSVTRRARARRLWRFRIRHHSSRRRGLRRYRYVGIERWIVHHVLSANRAELKPSVLQSDSAIRIRCSVGDVDRRRVARGRRPDVEADATIDEYQILYVAELAGRGAWQRIRFGEIGRRGLLGEHRSAKPN